MTFSRPGIVVASIYLVAALTIWIADARTPKSGWITLNGIVPFLLTLPISAPLAMIGLEPDMSNYAVVVLLILLCAGLLYQVTVWIVRLFT